MVGLKDMIGDGGALGSFLGLPQAAPGSVEADIVIFGANCATPYDTVGAYCAGGPAAMRAGSAAYAGDTTKVNFDLGGPVLPHGVRAVDAGDLPVNPSDSANNRALIETTTRALL